MFQSVAPGSSGSPTATCVLLEGDREICVRPGVTVVGRSADCDVVFTDESVAPQHFRLIFEPPELSIEDLDSGRGTSVNGEALTARCFLYEDDTIRMGTLEIRVVGHAEVGALDDRPTPPSSIGMLGRIAIAKLARHDAVAREDFPDSSVAGAATVIDADNLESALRMSDRMFALGRREDAVAFLGTHLERILEASRFGAVLQSRLVDLFGRAAVKLARETGDGRWLDLAIEAHLHITRPLRDQTCKDLVALRKRGCVGESLLIARYFETLRAERANMESGEQELCANVAALIPGLDESE